MGKTQTGKKSPAKTPPSRAAKTWRSPPYHSTNERKRGSGPVGRGGKVLVDKQSGGKGKQSGGYTSSSSLASGSDAESDSNNEGNYHHGLVGKKTTASREELLTMLREKERKIKKLQTELDYMKNKSRPNKKSLREIMRWSVEEINFSDSVNTFVRVFLFPRYKFLREGWQNFQPDKKNSLSSMCLRRLSLPEGSDKEEIWERVIVPSIQMK